MRAWLSHPAIECVFDREVPGLEDLPAADLVVVAAALGSAPLLPAALPLTPVRGQVSWSHEIPPGLPLSPVNGNGHFLPAAQVDGRPAWLAHSIFRKD